MLCYYILNKYLRGDFLLNLIEDQSINLRINLLYDEMDRSLNDFKLYGNGINSFIEISNDIADLILNHSIRYRNLSISGYLHNHLINVAILVGKLGVYYKVNNLNDLVLGGVLHDIGKLYIESSILNKKGRLTIPEKMAVEEHTTIGFKIISYFSNSEYVSDMILNHHSIINSLSDPIEISRINDKKVLFSILCGIADITDAMLSYRPYKKPLSIDVLKDDLFNKGIKEIEDILKNVL